MSLLSFLGCSPAHELPAKLADLRAEILVEHITEAGGDSAPYTRHSVTAVLRDARGRAIERGDVRVEVNGVPLEFRVSTGNYYDRHPYYQLSNDARISAAPATEYRFALVLPDGTRHDVGTVGMPATLDRAQFDFHANGRALTGVSFAWRDVAEPASLTIFRSDLRRESDGTQVNESGSSNDPAALRRTIGRAWFRGRSDRWNLPAAFLAESPDRKLSALGAELKIVHEGHVSNTLAKTSTLRAERRLTLRLENEERR